jgi:subtilisin family serine protease
MALGKLQYAGFIFFLSFLILTQTSFAQDTKRYLVYLKDKKANPYSIKEPQKFLSKRAIERREKYKIELTTRDLPVNPTYIQQVNTLGAKIWYSSKWFNALVIETDDMGLGKIKKLPFVQNDIVLLTTRKVNSNTKSLTIEPLNKEQNTNNYNQKPLNIIDLADYGYALNQAKMLGVPDMHQMGFRGKGMMIAVFDSGFENANKIPFFSHLFENKKIIGTYNFVENKEDVFNTGSHGLQVFSTIAAYEKGKFIGIAPEADFFLCRTEDANSEYRIEEINWLIAAEKADSIGVDVINSSLGYNTFDDENMNYTYKQLDGNTTFITKAADFAAATGMLVVNSAGNEGEDPWRYIGAPADADSILTVGAVNREGEYAKFSSLGPNAKGKLKPDVVSQGSPAFVIKPSGNVGQNFGTSFSSPIMAGFAAAIWQAYPKLNNMEIIQLIRESGHQAQKPDNYMGYGIPDFARIQQIYEKKYKKK